MAVALIYVRQSRHKAYERTVSPETQEASCRALPAVQACHEVVVYRDLDVSGGKRGRRGYMAMLERIRTDGAVRVVAFYDPSRIARDNLLSAEFYALMEQHPEIDVALVEGGPFDRRPSGEFTWTVLGAAATHLRKETGVKIRASKRYAASQGQTVGQVPAGYRWQGEGRDRQLVIDEDLAPIVRQVFEEYATGRFSARDIARRLNAEGVVLPSFKGGWRMDTVSQMLGNPAYAGYTYLSRKRREGELIRGQWQAIVELDTWQAVQLLIQRRRIVHGGRKTEAETRAYAFRGLLRCARCGRRMHAHHIHGRNYFDCRGSDSPNPCRGMLREDRLFPWAEALFQSIDAYRPADLAEAVDERLQQPVSHASPMALAQIDATLARLGKRYEWGHVDEATYLTEHARLTQHREELAQAANRPVPTSLPIGSMMEGWRTGDPQIRRRLLGAFFDEIDVLDGEVVSLVPRAEYAAEVVALLENVAAVTRSSPGGIRGDGDDMVSPPLFRVA